jgi:hypothetical protein
MSIRNIPTRYNEITFRSRREARWAVFWDELGVKYFYEYEGFQLQSGWYIPDFWLPHLKIWVEIKANEPSQEALNKAKEVCWCTNKPLLLYWDDVVETASPQSLMFWFVAGLVEGDPKELVLYQEEGWEWKECDDCGQLFVGYSGGDGNQIRNCLCRNRALGKAPSRLEEAYREAQTYRFY